MKYRITMLAAACLMAAPLSLSAQPKVCPPGEAVGNADCVRPGVAKNVLERSSERREERRERRSDRREDIEHPVARHIAVGQILDKDFKDFREVVDFQRLGLPRPNANVAYWQIGERVVAVDRDSREVLRIFNPS